MTSKQTHCEILLSGLCAAAALADRSAAIGDVFRRLCVLGNIRKLPRAPRWSGVTDDCTPIELSIAIGRRRARIRFLIEAQDDPASAMSYWKAGTRVSRSLIEDHGACAERLNAIANLFVPTDPMSFFAVWHSVEFGADGAPLCKIYLNPAARGRRGSAEVVREALARLGFASVVAPIMSMLSGNDIFTHLALDLSDRPGARVKIYMRHFNARPADLDAKAAALGLGDGAELQSVCRILCDGASKLSQRPVMTCVQLTDADNGRPGRITLYVPLYPYAESDVIASDRIGALLDGLDLPRDA